jgi:hypothetical protein
MNTATMPLLALSHLALFVLLSQSTVESSTGYLSRQRPKRRDIDLSESLRKERKLEVNWLTPLLLCLLLQRVLKAIKSA